MRKFFAANLFVIVSLAFTLTAGRPAGATTPAVVTFSVRSAVHCTWPAQPQWSGLDSVVIAGGSNPQQVTVGEEEIVNFDDLTYIAVAGSSPVAWLTLHVTGPVTPNGDIVLIAGVDPPELVFRATGIGPVAVSVVSTNSAAVDNVTGQVVWLQCLAIDPANVVTSFTTTTTPVCLGVPATMVWGPGDDVIKGTSGDDVIFAGSGNDSVLGQGGDDLICGGDGDDHLDGRNGNDTIDGGSGNDVLSGAAGRDLLDGGQGLDSADGGKGRDTCRRDETFFHC